MSDEPDLVMDSFGNLWQRYNDVGYVQLICTSRYARAPQPTLTALVDMVGPVQRMIPG